MIVYDEYQHEQEEREGVDVDLRSSFDGLIEKEGAA